MGIVQATKKMLGRESEEQDYSAGWTKRLFDAQGNEIELVHFNELYHVSGTGRWVSEQFPQDGCYWLVYNTNESDRPFGSAQLIIVNADGVHHVIYSLSSPERDIEAYDRDPRTTMPEVVKTAIRELVPTRI